jgi:hypothetical protein
MWESRISFPRGRFSTRDVVLFFATLLVSCFAYLFAAATPVYAADATWEGNNLSYEGDTYEPLDTADTTGIDLPNGANAFQFIPSVSGVTKNVKIIYFDGGQTPASAKEATYVVYTLNPPNRYSNPRDRQSITVTANNSLNGADTEDGAITDTCTLDGIGWIVCPIMHGIAEGMDFVYNRIRGFLTVQPITNSVDNPIYRVWTFSRDIANILFVIGFIVIIYSYLVGGGFNGYEIRKIIPRLVVAAILINVSYILCAAAVDLSNIAGYSVNQLFENVRDGLLPGSSAGDNVDVNWTSVTAAVLAGGGGAIALASVLPGATAGAFGAGLWFLLAPFLVGGALLVVVTFFILAARQAIIILFIAIAPLAFAAFILPNTEKWFDKWRSVFFTMLVMFPAFAAIFGGAQLAGEVIIRTANGIELVILGLGVMVAPLAITPLLLRLGGGVLNRFGGIVNNAEKGVFDRFKNYNNERRQDYLAGQNRLNAQRMREGQPINRFRRAAYNQNLKKYNRKRLRDANEGYVNKLYEDNDDGVETAASRARRSYAQARHRTPPAPHFKYGSSDISDINHRAELLGQNTHARHDEHWQHELQHTPGLRTMLEDTRLTEGRAKILSGAMEAQDERTLQTALNTEANYAALRAMKVQTSVDAGVADIQKNAVEAAGKLALSTEVRGDRDLRLTKVATYANEKQAETIDSILQKNAETRWQQRSRTEDQLQGIRLEETRANTAAKDAEEKWNSLIENIKARGNEVNVAGNLVVPDLAASNANLAGAIKAINREIETESEVQKSAKYVQQTDFTQALNNSVQLRSRAGGVDPRGASRVLSAAKAAVTKELITNTDNFQNTLDYDVASDIDELSRRFKALPNDVAFIPERVAYARLLARNGSPGVRELMDVLGSYTAALPPTDDTVMLLKEILAGEQSIKTSSRAFEVWSQNERNDNGDLYANFDEVNNTVGVWKSITGQRFASMSQPAQEQALTLLETDDRANGTTNLQRLVERVSQDPSAMSSIKDKPLRMVQAVLRGEDPSSIR